VREVQRRVAELYLDRDRRRGAGPTFLWLMEEVGELAEAVRRNERDRIEEELADVVAWTASLANLLDVDLEASFERKYPAACLRCGARPCACPEASAPPL
jgi:NTP pyrophosphatase (non-canonical NTP hydrolase)